jgi:hypothetical protein
MATYTGGTLTIAHSANASVTVGVATGVTIPHAVSSQLTMSAGSGASQVNLQASATVRPAGSNVDIDLAGGSQLNDGDGGAVTFASIKSFVFRAKAANTGNITVATTLANGWQAAFNGTVVLRPGEIFAWQSPQATGVAVTAGTGDLVRISGTGTDDCDVLVTGLLPV